MDVSSDLHANDRKHDMQLHIEHMREMVLNAIAKIAHGALSLLKIMFGQRERKRKIKTKKRENRMRCGDDC